jgi:hypothetical protein
MSIAHSAIAEQPIAALAGLFGHRPPGQRTLMPQAARREVAGARDQQIISPRPE